MTPDTPNSSNTLTEELTIGQMFGLSADLKLDETPASTAPSVEELRKKIPPSCSWTVVQAEVATSLNNTLHAGLIETLAQGWAHYRALIEDAQQSRKAPQNQILSTLAHHDIDSTLRPYVDIYVGPTLIKRIPFEVSLTTTIDGLQLGLENGKITFVQMGQCEWKGTIATTSIPLIQKTTEPLHLPGRIHLKHPIPLIRD